MRWRRAPTPRSRASVSSFCERSTPCARRFEGFYQRFNMRDGNDVGPDDEQRFLLCSRLLECIATFSSRIFSRRHVLLRTNAAFAARSRDPVPPPAPPRRQDPA